MLRKHGFEAYSRSLGFWNECGNVHLSDPQYADLGDGEGWTKLEYLMRESLVPWVGSCVQSVIGEFSRTNGGRNYLSELTRRDLLQAVITTEHGSSPDLSHRHERSSSQHLKKSYVATTTISRPHSPFLIVPRTLEEITRSSQTATTSVAT